MYPHTNAQNYTPSIKQSQIDLISKMFTKNDWIKNLTNFDSDFYVLIKEEVEELFFNTNGYLNYLDFESVYRLSVEMTIYQINKKLKKNKESFFEKHLEDNPKICIIVKQRLVNNIKNLFDKHRKFNLNKHEMMILNSIYETTYKDESIIYDLEKILKYDPKLVFKYIKILVKNFELSTDEAEELCFKLNINFKKLFRKSFKNELKLIKKELDNQLYIDFNMMKAA
ncbi:hypothetical protein ACOL3C_09230 [Aliarcobacter butzleri]